MKKAIGYSRTDFRYWKERVERRISPSTGKPGADFSVQIAYKGERVRFALETPNKDAAAKKAQEIFQSLQATGWQSTLAKFKPAKAKQSDATVGQLIAAATALSSARAESKEEYAKAFRRIVAGIFGIGHGNKYNAKQGGSEAWRNKVDKVKLSKITPAKVLKWKNRFLEENGKTPEAKERAAITVNSLIRNARALFAAKLMRFLTEEIVLPAELPFDGIQKEKEPSRRYRSRIDAGSILGDAQTELARSDPEAFKLLLLCLVCGLRRSEADMLTWDAFDFSKGRLHIEATEYMTLKSADSAGELDLDETTVSLFRGFNARASSEFVVESPYSHERQSRSYRCDAIQKRLLRWLRGKGVNSRKPLHTLRKEIGAILATEKGIFAASRYLRHSDLRITAQYYADQKTPVAVNLGKLLDPSKKANTVQGDFHRESA